MTINNLPVNFTDYPFIVARRDGAEWWFWGAYRNRNEANEDALEIGGTTWETSQVTRGWC